MNKIQAINILTQATAEVSTNRAGHQTIQEALSYINTLEEPVKENDK